MIFLELTIDLIVRLLGSTEKKHVERLGREIDDLLLSADQTWLPEDVENGGEAFETLWQSCDQQKKSRLAELLLTRVDAWCNSSDLQSHRSGIAVAFYLSTRLHDVPPSLVSRLKDVPIESVGILIAGDEQSLALDREASWIINGWITLHPSTDLSEADEALLILIRECPNIQNATRVHCELRILENSLSLGRRRIVESAIPNLLTDVNSLSAGMLETALRSDHAVSRFGLAAEDIALILAEFFKCVATEAFQHYRVSEQVAVLSRILDRQYFVGTKADGTFRFVVQSVLGEHVVECAAETGTGSVILARILADIPFVQSLQACEILKLTQNAFFFALSAYFQNDIDQVEERFPFNSDLLETKAKELSMSTFLTTA